MGRGGRTSHDRRVRTSSSIPCCREVRIGGLPARLSCASATELSAIVPAGLDGGHTPGARRRVRRARRRSSRSARRSRPAFTRWTARRSTRTAISTSPSAARAASRRRSSIFLVRPDGSREPFVVGSGESDVAGVRSARAGCTCRAVSKAPCIASTRRRADVVASDLGVACGLAFAPDGTLFVGDRSGTIFRVARGTADRRSRRCPPSVAAFHLAFGPDGCLYVTAPTLGARDSVYRISPDGDVDVFFTRLRPAAGPRLRLPRRSLRRRRARRRQRRVPLRASIVRRCRSSSSPEARSSGSRSIRLAASCWRRATRCFACEFPPQPNPRFGIRARAT